jgi:hypothetical protein
LAVDEPRGARDRFRTGLQDAAVKDGSRPSGPPPKPRADARGSWVRPPRWPTGYELPRRLFRRVRWENRFRHDRQRSQLPTSGRIASCSLRQGQAACGGGPDGPALPAAARDAQHADRSGRRDGRASRTKGQNFGFLLLTGFSSYECGRRWSRRCLRQIGWCP